MRILLLGGTHFVGRAIAAYAVASGHQVTALNRGHSEAPPGVRTLIADRLDRASMEDALAGEGDWDQVIDTWSLAPSAVADACSLVAGRAGHYSYVSSRSVYTWPIASGANESAEVVAGDPDASSEGDYAADKRGGELAVLRTFPEHHLLARAGMILGPDENIGRLPYWLSRYAEGPVVLAPGTPDRPLQFIDARDLAAWVVDAPSRGVRGIFDTVSRPGHTTMGELLAACAEVTGSTARTEWVEEAWLTDREITGWVDLPIWAPVDSEIDSLHDGDTSAARASGLVCRPAAETVADTWEWVRQLSETPRRDAYLSRQREEELLAEWSALPR